MLAFPELIAIYLACLINVFLGGMSLQVKLLCLFVEFVCLSPAEDWSHRSCPESRTDP